MKTTTKPLRDVPYFSSAFHAYLNQDPALRPFYHRYPSSDAIAAQRSDRSFPSEHRKLLRQVITEQYNALDMPDAVRKNIESLEKDNCYTVTTGHQLNLFTGPLYVILKMITTINTCEALARQNPDACFVPVYWMASEDHDFDEIDHFNFNGETYRWETDQQGAVGRFSLNDIRPLLRRLSAFPPEFLNAYESSDTLSGAVRKYMNNLFGEYGLVVLDADDHRLKGLFRQVMHDDILEGSIEPLVNKTTSSMEEKGFKSQVNARRVNFFYLENDVRDRIETDGDGFRLAESGRRFSRDEMERIIDESPEQLSPNVILRPLYEETILPNLAYCGGPSELIYWLQLKSVFEHYQVPFPVLLPRNFAMIIPAHLSRKWNKTRCSLDDLFLDRHTLLEKVALRDSEREVKLNGQKKEIEEAFRKIHDQAMSIDPTMGQHVEAQWARTERRLEIIEKKFIRAEKRHHEELIGQVCDVCDKLFPGGGLQERHDNIMNFLQTNPNIIRELKKSLEPFDFSFNILRYGE